MERSLWTERLTKTSCPAWTCSICGKGFLSSYGETKFFLTAASNAANRVSDSKYNHEFIVTAWAKCSNRKCEQKFAILGSGHNEKEFPDNPDSTSDLYFTPKACHPMPDIISIPHNVPKTINELLKDSFKLFFIDTNSCAAKIRTSLEYLLDHFGIIRERTNSKGKLCELKLHARLEEYEKVEPNRASKLLAIKWLGNAGAHEHGNVNQDGLLDAYEIMENVLKDIFCPREPEITALANNLTNKYKP